MSREEILQIYGDIISRCDEIELKGKNNPYTSANGHMFSMINKDNQLGFRYSKEVQEKYIAEWNSDYLISYGATMRGYVVIPENMHDDPDQLAKYLQESHEYVLSLEPK